VIVGLDARGFIFAPALALRLNIRFVPVRKRGKLPGECVQAKYVKEYGEDIFEMQKGRMTSSDRVVVVDDLIATGTNSPLPQPPSTPFSLKRIPSFVIQPFTLFLTTSFEFLILLTR
jgi:hypothetical protein